MNRSLPRLPLAILISAVTWSVLMAQDQKPTAPFVRNAPPNSAWTVEYLKAGSEDRKGQTAPPTGKAYLKKTEVTKFGQARRDVDEWSDGSKVEKWYYQGYHLFEQRGTPDIYVINSSSDSMLKTAYPDFRKADFPELDWLSATTYVGEDSFQGRSGHLFEKVAQASAGPVVLAKKPSDSRATPPPAPAVPPQKVRVWIDRETRLPLAMQNGSRTRVYAFRESEGGNPIVPERFVKALQNFQAARAVPAAK